MWSITASNLPQACVEAAPLWTLSYDLQRSPLENVSHLQQLWPMGADHIHLLILDSDLLSKCLPSLGHSFQAVCPGSKCSHLISLLHNSHLKKKH